MHVRDLAGHSGHPVVEIEVSLACELLMSLYAFSHPEERDTYEIGLGWFEEVTARAPADLIATVTRLGPGLGHMWAHLVGLTWQSEPPRDIPAFLAHLDALTPLELRLSLLGYHLRAAHDEVSPEVIHGAAAGDPAAQDAFLHVLADHPEKLDILRGFLAQQPQETKEMVLELLRRWYETVFRAQEPELELVLARDAEAKRRLLGRLSPERLIEQATNGVQYSPQAGIRRVVLVPSAILRPWVLISENRDAKIICYSVAEESLAPDVDAGPARLIKVYKALSDERRLLILKRLAGTNDTLQELADALGIGKSLAHHHVVALRAAGLVRVSTGEDKRYSLREDAIADVGDLLSTYLTERPAAGPPSRRRIPAARRRGP